MPEPSRSPSAVAPEPQGHGPAQGVPDGRPPLLSLPRLRTLQLVSWPCFSKALPLKPPSRRYPPGENGPSLRRDSGCPATPFVTFFVGPWHPGESCPTTHPRTSLSSPGAQSHSFTFSLFMC
ncbi:unnamed protein product [Rangifer tarandus platyrhynchus]|uniref:Uncharacterized protein n=1 Tax=Rangifer tarandus platyrhynchus TaxID=3082113 RepID=A0AC59ZDL1_RANTA